MDAEATFSIRGGESVTLYEEMPPLLDYQRLYAVALIEAPHFPGEHHQESKPLSVVCAGLYRLVGESEPTPVKWGWEHLTPDTKTEIGHALVNDMNATPGRWYYLVVEPASLTEWQGIYN